MQEALQVAEEASLDLVEVAPQESPPVCKVLDYGKERYEARKKLHNAKRKQKRIVVKEVKFRPVTDIGDYDTKLKKLQQFLKEGNKAKVTMKFRGREAKHSELGEEMLRRVERDLVDFAVVEQEPTQEGKQMIMLLAPARK